VAGKGRRGKREKGRQIQSEQAGKSRTRVRKWDAGNMEKQEKEYYATTEHVVDVGT
jgi:hypothetical protein